MADETSQLLVPSLPVEPRILLEVCNVSLRPKAWFSYVGKIPDDRGFYFLSTISDFADISAFGQRSVPDFPDYELFICDRGTGAQQFRGLVMSTIHRRRTPTSPTVQI